MNLKFFIVFLSALLVSISAPVRAQKEGKTIQGEPFVTGGVGLGDREAMEKERRKYSLWVQTAAKSGAFLSDSTVNILDKSGKPVLDAKLQGPWLFVNLKLGEYTVRATHDGKILEKRTHIHPGDHHEIVFHFDVPAEVLPKGAK